MRCPKCGYISFDHVEVCLKCNKNISKFAGSLEGTTYNVAPPLFLKFTSDDASQNEEKVAISFDAVDDEYDVIDPDLEVLVDGLDSKNKRSSGAGSPFENNAIFDDIGTEADSGMDLGQFEDASEKRKTGMASQGDVTLELPDELADISDLDAPSDEPGPMPEELPTPVEGGKNLGDLNLDLDLDGLADFSLTEKSTATETGQGKFGDLSFADLGLTGEEKKASAQTGSGNMDFDFDLDFDLDLSGVDLDMNK